MWKDDTRTQEWLRFTFPRQRKAPFLCISDFFRPGATGETDYAAFHVVTMGPIASAREKELFAADKYQDYLLLHGLSVEMAEALAELWHHRIREEWGFAGEDGPTLAGLFKQKYRGSRYSWGYPACPELEEQTKVAELLEIERIGVTLTEESTSCPSSRRRRSSCPTPKPSTSSSDQASIGRGIRPLPTHQGLRTARAMRSVPNAVRIARYSRPVAAITAE